MAEMSITRPDGRFKDRSGQTFGLLVALHRGAQSTDNRATWVCRCKCGSLVTVRTSCLVSGRTKSCGCGKSQFCRAASLRHGLTGRTEDGKQARTPEYDAWAHLIQRCCNKNNKSYKDYGGREITVSDEFRNSFEAFFAHVGPRPSPKHSIDRIENDKGYERGNLKWSTRLEQNRNRRRNRYIEAFGRRQLLTDWSRETGLAREAIAMRLSRGWDPERALSTPTKRSL